MPIFQQSASVPRPKFFGAESAPVINEVVTIWNAAAGETRARTTVERSGDSASGFTYSIPIVWKFELWNMSDQAIPVRDYSMRGMHVRQIRSSAFGFGAEPMPKSTEVVFSLGPLEFAPGEIKVVEYSETFTSSGPQDLGTTWNSFRLGPDRAGGLGTGSNSTQNTDDEPERHGRSSFVLFDTVTKQWIATTNYLDSTNVVGDGVAAIGPGNMGAAKGNLVNDPRSQPIRAYALNTALTGDVGIQSADSERDWGQQSPGSLGTINNQVNNRFYQHLGFWFDRPRIPSGQSENQALTNVQISRIRNGPMASIGELGNIFDPSWYNPRNRGLESQVVPYRRTLRPPFRGGASLRVGQPDGKAYYGANSWILTDVLSADHALDSTEKLIPLDQKDSPPVVFGLLNVNMPRLTTDGGVNRSTTELLFRLNSLDGAQNPLAPDPFDAKLLGDAVKSRLTKGSGIAKWTDAKPFFLTGELSELEQWKERKLYRPEETVAENPPGHPNRLVRVNRSDFGREEILQKSINMITTGGNAYRIYVVAQLASAPVDAPNRMTTISSVNRCFVVDFVAKFNDATGELQTLTPKISVIPHD